MGVVHKLQDEVRDFILAQKKDFPQISCRKLSDVVFEKFQLVVSKSSIGSVLKSANLNSPIGRHSLSLNEQRIFAKKDLKKFKIPPEKKIQIVPVPKSVSVTEVKKHSVVLPVAQSVSSGQKGSILKEKQMIQVPKEVSQKKEIFLERAGFIFLKAVEWEFAGGSILAKIFKDELGSSLDVDFDKVAESLLFSKINQAKDIADFKIPESLLKAAENIFDFGMKASIEVQALLQRASYIKIVNRDNKCVFVDLKSRNAHSENVQSEKEVSVTQAVQRINVEIFKNVQSAVFYYCAGENDIENLLKTLHNTFGNQKSNGVREIGLYNSQNIELVKYSYFPVKKRTFALAVFSWEKDLPWLANSLATAGDWESLKILDKTFYYKWCYQGDSSESQKSTEESFAVAVSFLPSEKPFVALLTNAEKLEIIKMVVLDFLLSSPHLSCDTNDSFLLGEKRDENYLKSINLEIGQLDQCKGFLESISALLEVFKNYCQQYFFDQKELSFDVNNLIEKVYDLPAFLCEEQRILRLSFCLSEKDLLFPMLKNAINRFNARVLFDPQGRRIVLRISSPTVP